MLFDVFAGSRADAPALIHDQTGKVVLDDKACDSNSLRATIANMEAEAVISSNRSRNIIIPQDPSSTSSAITSKGASIAEALPTVSPRY
ncbi:hypothetical protein HFO23_08440 [Rhizobium laguerreae]|uniref:hypothetical protein n=1 Tax=Rhizobium laguerreae TaxID=1076926 RepID=UPI001C90653F|nr:hypothetical protein [Rhizobium laguerreae]MBY3195091.1 hypothetical protein [Rhizobium laguerreae]MBY3517463.1 hypothetical protein [Rhizobium laguerreae]